MKNIGNKVGVLAVILLASGCASNKDAGESYAEMAAKKSELEAERIEQHIDRTPDWYLEPDKFDENGFYAVAQGESPSMSMALKMANLEAKKILAGNVSELISAQEKLFSKGNANNAGSTMQSTIESFIMEADVAGTVFDKKDVVRVGNNFVFYVRAYLPVKAIKEMQEKARFAQDLELASAEAQQELMLRVAKAKAQATKEKEAEAAAVKAEAERKAALLIQQAQLQEVAN